MLTAKQKQLLLHLKAEQDAGRSPSFEEMMVALDLRSKSNIHRLIVALEDRGFIRRNPARVRSVEVIRAPGDPVVPNWVADRLAQMERDISRLTRERDCAMKTLAVLEASYKDLCHEH